MIQHKHRELYRQMLRIRGGRGGSQHIQWKNFYANGILGGTVPLAVGMALGEMTSDTGKIVFSFLGDGTLGEGVVYESLNMASLWNLPVLFLVENNRYAQSTPVHLHLAGEITTRFEAFGIPAEEIDTADVSLIAASADRGSRLVRKGGGPRAIVIDTYRFAPHSKGDDSRDPEEIASFRKNDTILLQANRIEHKERKSIESEVDEEVAEAFQRAQADPVANPNDLTAPRGAIR
jgi:TPP-dependent pyruvate/acetoin dehydrogenase alpha subunit